MASLAEMPLDGGGWILVEAPEATGGPVKAGRLGEAIRELPTSLQTALAPVADAARTILEELRKAGPTEVEVEFGVDLAMQAGAVIAKSETSCHLKVRLTWQNGGANQTVG
ncbi:CU044_2847 family protein [Catellatospora sichuanensis]|uniref:CU044_2847 family protein n=1 Tax=Catellatospora sichuanensis TaxID=1969805 RepID=UPI001183684A|nr:CU044_2847 family protein [Catellatospora sichuanensis]